MGSGYKKLYEAMKQEKEQLVQLVEAQEREIELLEQKVELYKEGKEALSKYVDELLRVCKEQNAILVELRDKEESRENE